MGHPLWEKIVADEIEPPTMPYPLLVLTGKMRGYIIKKVKAPLQKALETGKNLSQVMKVIRIITDRMPLLTKKNKTCKKTALLGLIEERFFRCSSIKQEMFKGTFKLLKFEIEHDGWYGGVYDFLLEQHIMMVLTGEWPSRWENIPFPQYWKESRPYGGKHTIISAIQRNREKIIDLLGEEWAWLRRSYEFNPADNTRGIDGENPRE